MHNPGEKSENQKKTFDQKYENNAITCRKWFLKFKEYFDHTEQKALKDRQRFHINLVEYNIGKEN